MRDRYRNNGLARECSAVLQPVRRAHLSRVARRVRHASMRAHGLQSHVSLARRQ